MTRNARSIAARTGLLCVLVLTPAATIFAEASNAQDAVLAAATVQPPAAPGGPARPQLPARRPTAPPIDPPGINPTGGQGQTEDKPGAKPDGGTVPVADAPAPRDILAKHIKAVGGEDAIRKQTSRTKKLSISIDMMPGVNTQLDVKAKAPNRYLATMNGPMGEVKQGFDGKVGWMIVPGQGATILGDRQLAQMKLEAEFFRDLNLMTLYPKAETLGQRDFGGARCWDVKFSGGENEPTSYFFDLESGLMRGYETIVAGPMGETPAAMIITDWKDVDGVKHPFKMSQQIMGMNQVVTVESIDVTPLDDSVFALPMPVQAILDRQKESGDPAKAPPVEPK